MKNSHYGGLGQWVQIDVCVEMRVMKAVWLDNEIISWGKKSYQISGNSHFSHFLHTFRPSSTDASWVFRCQKRTEISSLFFSIFRYFLKMKLSELFLFRMRAFYWLMNGIHVFKLTHDERVLYWLTGLPVNRAARSETVSRLFCFLLVKDQWSQNACTKKSMNRFLCRDPNLIRVEAGSQWLLRLLIRFLRPVWETHHHAH